MDSPQAFLEVLLPDAILGCFLLCSSDFLFFFLNFCSVVPISPVWLSASDVYIYTHILTHIILLIYYIYILIY